MSEREFNLRFASKTPAAQSPSSPARVPESAGPAHRNPISRCASAAAYKSLVVPTAKTGCDGSLTPPAASTPDNTPTRALLQSASASQSDRREQKAAQPL